MVVMAATPSRSATFSTTTTRARPSRMKPTVELASSAPSATTASSRPWRRAEKSTHDGEAT